MMKRFLLACSLSLAFVSISASPAMPGKVRMKQPDGTYIEVFVRGDEYSNWYESAADGSIMQLGTDGFMKKVADKDAFFSAMRQMRAGRIASAGGASRVQPGKIDIDFPTTGEVRGLLLLVEYPDVKFTEEATREVYDRLMNAENYTGGLSTGSVRQYFRDQSGGKFTPIFDVAGPYCMSQPRKHYGSSDTGAEPVWEMFEEACNQAHAEGIDFTKYDCNGDGIVDFVFLIYAGHGQAQGGPAETVWPQQVNLEYKVWTTYDGMMLGKGACSCELHGSSGEQIDGIGTICHEFSHVLGLPDVYDVYYSGSYGMGNWDVMDVGSYNNDSRTPAGYTAMDKYTVGWLTPMLVDREEDTRQLRPLGESNEAYFIVSDKDANEYYTLENRQQTGWDAALNGHGMLVSHITYDKALWTSNRVNTTKNPYDHIELIAADNSLSESDEHGDTYPGSKGVTELSPATTPAQAWHAKGSTPFTLTGITETGDGIINFTYKSDSPTGISVPFIEAEIDGGLLSVSNPDCRKVEVFSADGKLVKTSVESMVAARLGKGIYVIKRGRHSIKVSVR